MCYLYTTAASDLLRIGERRYRSTFTSLPAKDSNLDNDIQSVAAYRLAERGLAERAGFAPAARLAARTRLAGGPIRLLWHLSTSGPTENRTLRNYLAKAACALHIPLGGGHAALRNQFL